MLVAKRVIVSVVLALTFQLLAFDVVLVCDSAKSPSENADWKKLDCKKSGGHFVGRGHEWMPERVESCKWSVSFKSEGEFFEHFYNHNDPEYKGGTGMKGVSSRCRFDHDDFQAIFRDLHELTKREKALEEREKKLEEQISNLNSECKRR